MTAQPTSARERGAVLLAEEAQVRAALEAVERGCKPAATLTVHAEALPRYEEEARRRDLAARAAVVPYYTSEWIDFTVARAEPLLAAHAALARVPPGPAQMALYGLLYGYDAPSIAEYVEDHYPERDRERGAVEARLALQLRCSPAAAERVLAALLPRTGDAVERPVPPEVEARAGELLAAAALLGLPDASAVLRLLPRAPRARRGK